MENYFDSTNLGVCVDERPDTQSPFSLVGFVAFFDVTRNAQLSLADDGEGFCQLVNRTNLCVVMSLKTLDYFYLDPVIIL